MVAYSYKGRFVAPVRVGLGLPVQDEHRELGGYQPGQSDGAVATWKMIEEGK